MGISKSFDNITEELEIEISSLEPKNSQIKIKMSTWAQKHRNFIAGPMSDKPVTELAGIGGTLGGRLSAKGFDKAYVVLGQFLVLKKNRDLFVDWLKDYAGANSKQAADCYQCLSDWCDEFL